MDKKTEIFYLILLGISVITLLFVLIPQLPTLAMSSGRVGAAEHQAAPAPQPSLPAYVKSSVLKDIASTSFISVSFVLVLIIAALLVKALIKRRKEKELFWGY
jgi:hypothetical protein